MGMEIKMDQHNDVSQPAGVQNTLLPALVR